MCACVWRGDADRGDLAAHHDASGDVDAAVESGGAKRAAPLQEWRLRPPRSLPPTRSRITPKGPSHRNSEANFAGAAPPSATFPATQRASDRGGAFDRNRRATPHERARRSTLNDRRMRPPRSPATTRHASIRALDRNGRGKLHARAAQRDRRLRPPPSPPQKRMNCAPSPLTRLLQPLTRACCNH